ncbi:MAG: hypothetical protein JRD89_05915, partial [Deltaproteobacteria bacterium]|nr:hypothetical protein [Deltaproteobacteria bacterium]
METGRWHIEGDYLRLYSPETETWRFYYVKQREQALYIHKWSEKISPNTESGPEDLEDLKPLALNRLDQVIFGVKTRLDQVIFGVKTRCLVYLNLPHETRRWGTDKKPIATSDLREVGYVDEEISPYEEPSFLTEFFLQKGGSYEYPHLYAYNPTNRTLKPTIMFRINKLIVEEITRQRYPELYD